VAVEEHGNGRQMVHFRVWPRPAIRRLILLLVLAGLTLGAVVNGAQAAATVLGVLALALGIYAFDGCAVATGAILRALSRCAATITDE
jgi:hypothetical protein